MKKGFILPVLLVCVMGVTGCMINRSSFQEEAVSYMKEKYDENFSWIEPAGAEQESEYFLQASQIIFVFPLVLQLAVQTDDLLHLQAGADTRILKKHLRRIAFRLEHSLYLGIFFAELFFHQETESVGNGGSPRYCEDGRPGKTRIREGFPENRGRDQAAACSFD
jgi:hypothetical protein